MTALVNDSIIRIREVTKRYRGAKEMALRGINLEIERGTFFGLLGPNGSGKTTLISILCGLLRASSGDITLNGRSIPRQLQKIKSFIGLVPQEIALYPTLTLRQNLSFFASLYRLPTKTAKARIDDCIQLAALEHCCDRPIDTYSGGMKRRANLVVSLLNDPEILFLDEPTVNVDPQSRHMIYDILNRLNANGITLVYTTHYLEEVELMCKQIAIIDRGAVLCQDSPQNLIQNSAHSQSLADVFFNYTGRELRD